MIFYWLLILQLRQLSIFPLSKSGEFKCFLKQWHFLNAVTAINLSTYMSSDIATLYSQDYLLSVLSWNPKVRRLKSKLFFCLDKSSTTLFGLSSAKNKQAKRLLTSK